LISPVPTSTQDIFLSKSPARNAWTEEMPKSPVVIGVVCTVLFHLLLWLGAPLLPLGTWGDGSNLAKEKDANAGKTFDFLLERLPAAEEPPEQMHFVETNPEAPTNEPDKTNNYSNRNQQTAQEEAATEIDPAKRPSVKGREDMEKNSAIVAGDMALPQDAAAAPPELLAQEQQVQEAREEQVPLSGFEKKEGDNEGGIGTNVSQRETPTNKAEHYAEGIKDGKGANAGVNTVAQSSKPQPKPRPKLARARPNILTNQVAGTTNIGVTGQDARWSEFGEYLQEFIEIVQAQWYLILEDSAVYPKGSHVSVTFRINSAGEVSIIKVENTAGQHGTYACLNAIQERQPYRKWTEQMIKIMGTNQTLTFSFYYQ
jgi:hypothetical protein